MSEMIFYTIGQLEDMIGSNGKSGLGFLPPEFSQPSLDRYVSMAPYRRCCRRPAERQLFSARCGGSASR
jgi:hypothetical protein